MPIKMLPIVGGTIKIYSNSSPAILKFEVYCFHKVANGDFKLERGWKLFVEYWVRLGGLKFSAVIF